MSEEKIKEQTSPASLSSKTASVDTNPYFQDSSRKTQRLPDWLDHFNSKDLKTLFKCCLAVWIYSLFIFINPTLKVIGQATFFGILPMFMVPPSGVVFIGLTAGATIILGASLGWAWGTITMKAALATRPAADLQAQYARLQQENTRNTTNSQQASGQATFTQIAIYNGGMLDTRVSVTYFCMIGLFIYLVARLRVAVPKLALLQIFAMIISDIYLTIAPLIPTFQGTIPRTLILPAAIGMGVSFVCNILLFPRSTSHLVLDGMQDVLKPMDTFLEACLLNFQSPENHMELGRLMATKAEVVQAFKALEGNFGFLALDASVGRWGTDDVKTLHEPLRRILVMFVSLIQVQIARRETKLRDQKLDEMADFVQPSRREDVQAGTQHLSKIYDFRQRSKHPDGEELLKGSLRAMGSAGIDVIAACQQALVAMNQSLRLSNTRRWFRRLTPQQCAETYKSHSAILATLQQHKNAFAGRAASDLWDNHKHMFDAQNKLTVGPDDSHHPPMAGIMLSLVLEERLYNFADALETMLARLVELEQTRTQVRLWLPGKLNYFVTWILEKDVSTNMGTGDLPSTSTAEEDEVLYAVESHARSKAEEKQLKKKKSKKGDEDDTEVNSAAKQIKDMRVRGVHKRSSFSRFIIGVAHWFTNTEGLYALRILIVTIAIGVPAVLPSSAGFYYREKGLWALIMSQTGMLPYTADFIASFFLRMVGTVVGAVLGLLIWYIGAGNGPGNPYGMAAVIVPVIIVFMWVRLFASPALLQGCILTVITCYLVMAYSWSDTHIPSYGNPGVGYPVFWRRMLLVIIGMSAAVIVTLFQHPPSSSKHHRRLLSESIQTVKNQYALFVLNLKNPMPDLKQVSEKTAVDASNVLLTMQPSLKLLKLEISASNYTADSLSTVCRLCMTLNQTVTQLLIYATALPDHAKQRFLRVTGAADEALVADLMAVLSIVQQSLKTGDPLPAVLPTPLLVRAMEGAIHRTTDDEHAIVMNKEILTDPTTRRFCSAMSAFVQFFGAADELVLVAKRAVGETTYIDIEDAPLLGSRFAI